MSKPNDCCKAWKPTQPVSPDDTQCLWRTKIVFGFLFVFIFVFAFVFVFVFEGGPNLSQLMTASVGGTPSSISGHHRKSIQKANVRNLHISSDISGQKDRETCCVNWNILLQRRAI